MAKGCLTDKKGVCTAIVSSNTSISRKFYLLKLKIIDQTPKIFAKAIPGQFIELCVDDLATPPLTEIPEHLLDKSQRNIILRRPFSFSDIHIKSDSVQLDIMYCVLGPATLQMTTLKQGDQVSIIGPLGNGFSIQPQKRTALLIAGGMGAPPIRHLMKCIEQCHSNTKVVLFSGAKTADDLPYKPDSDADSHIATDDGSQGFAGFVTDRLAQWLNDNSPSISETVIYACGPEPMLAETAKIAYKHQIDCQVSLERMMACGIGLCQSCAVKCKTDGSDEGAYKLCCKDGPVFDSREVEW